MAYVTPSYSRGEVRRAGELLTRGGCTLEELVQATTILTNWRASHAYLLNTFQSTLRTKLRYVDKGAVVGQRLKRAPSVITKLLRFPTMGLNQMQDIAGLRAIVDGTPKLRRLHEKYLSSRFTHELVNTKDYVESPKADGYRSIHLVYRYQNPRASAYDGLHLELQMRTKLQHAWATAVETVDAFVGEAIKAGRPSENWADFFKLASSAFARVERCSPPAEYRNLSAKQLLTLLKRAEAQLNVLLRLRGFGVAAQNISASGRFSSYHLVVLDLSVRRLTIKSFSLAQQEEANAAYAAAEERARQGAHLDPVLVAGGSLRALRQAYPNYFLDTQVFVQRLRSILTSNSLSF